MELKEDFELKSQLVDSYLRDLMDSAKGIPEPLFSSMKYSLLSKGKHLRPILLLTTLEMFSYDVKNGLPFAAAIEMIHTYSLIHDDLPSMDNSDFRRNLPSNHKKFGDGMALLAGDSLLNLACEVALSSEDYPAEIVNEATRALFIKSGAFGMAAGQCLDLNQVNSEVTLDDLILIADYKTACLITAAVQCGAILGKANKEELNSLTLFARNLGIAFQIKDDILDVINNEKNDESITTFVDIIGLDKAKELCKIYTDTAIENLQNLKYDTTKLKYIAELMLNRVR